MFNLGSVNFSLGADARGLQASLQQLQNFGRVVEQVSQDTSKAGERTAASFRKQEQAAVNALNKTMLLTQQMNKVRGGERFASDAARSFAQLNSELTRGQLSALQYQRAMERFQVATTGTLRTFRDFSQAQRAAAGHTTSFADGMRALQSSVVLIQGPLGGVATRVSNITALMNGTTAGIAAFTAGMAGAAYTAGTLGSAIFQAGKQLNGFLGQFISIEGTMEGAEKQMRKIILIARQTGQRVEDLAPAFARFNIAAEGTGITTRQVEEAFTVLASAATKLQLTQEQSVGIFRAIEQMMSKGTIQAEELRGQLGDRLAGAVQISARAMGVTTRELQKMMKAGELVTSGFLPKFIEELRKTLNIDGKPIDNYTAAINNMSTAWFQLRIAMDAQLGITNMVMNAYKTITGLLDTIRQNLDTVKIAAIALSGALAGVIAPMIIGGFFSLGKAIGVLVFQMGILNKVMMANPLFRLAHIALIIGGSIAAVYEFRDSIQVLNGEIGSLGDYMRVALQEIQNDSSVKAIQAQFDSLSEGIALSFKGLGREWSITWIDLTKTAYSGVNYILDVFYNLNDAIPLILSGIPAFFGSMAVEAANRIIEEFERAWNYIMEKARESAAGWVKAFPSLAKIMPAFDDVSLQGFENKYIGMWKNMEAEVNSIMSRQNDILGETISKIDEYRRRANEIGIARIFSDPSRALDIYKAPMADRDIGAGARDESALTEKQIKALNKKFEAIKAINDELVRTYEEIDALGVAGTAFEKLTAQFKRDAEVEKYAKALRKAGVETQFITQKTRELAVALEKRDLLMKQREAIIELRDTMVEGFDAIGQSIIDGLFEGRNALESFKMVLKNFVADIIKTWLQLAVLNPIKNYLFGTDERALPGGFFGNIAKGLPGLFGTAAQGKSGDYWGGMRGANDNWTGIGASLASAMPAIGTGTRGSRLAPVLGRMGMSSMQQYAAAIRQVESGSFSGNYNAMGPMVRGDRAYGAYQVMGNNIPSWTKQALGSSMTPQSFLGNKGAQDSVFQKFFGDALRRYGNPQDAASVWFSGRPMAKAGNASDTFNTVPQYIKKFNDALTKVTTQTTDVSKAFTNLNQVTPPAVQGLQTLGKGFNTAGQNITQAAQQIVMAPQAGGGGGFLGMIGNFFQSLFGGLFGGLGGGTPFMMAKGDVINSPTAFRSGGGLAIGGESGPEAVMPLTRDNHGNLGVMASMSALKNPGGNVIVNIFAPEGSGVNTKQSSNDNGDTVLEVFIEAAKSSIAGDIAKGGTALNKSIEGRYSLRSASGLK